MSKIFDGVAGNSPALNRFDLSYTNTTTAKIGLLYPVQCDEVYPGDVFKMSAFCHAEVQPMVAPLMSDLSLYAHTFFVPYRILYGVDNADGKSIWEKFITGGEDGEYDTALPAWSPNFDKTTFSSETIWDCIGNPVNYAVGLDSKYHWTPIVPGNLDVSIAPKYAYNMIYNSWFRDENLVDEVALTNEDLLNVSFTKDYFTSALESQQKGISPAIEVNGTIPISVGSSGSSILRLTYGVGGVESWPGSSGGVRVPVNSIVYNSGTNTFVVPIPPADATPQSALHITGDEAGTVTSMNDLNSKWTGIGVNLPTLTGIANGHLSAVDINQLRLMFATQRLLELNMRAGTRYTEFLQAHFGAHPTDERLDRPEYIGGCMIPISVSPLVQTSETGTTPQGNKAGIANINSIQKLGNYRALEHGLIMTLINIVPKPIYQQGVNRQWLRQDRFSYYFPEFAYLSEVGIYNAEIFATGVAHNGSTVGDDDIFGYQAAWNELRCKNNLATGAVREQFDYWTMARKFGSRPALNQDFIEVKDSDFNRIFAVQDEDEFIISWSNLIDAYRPIPAMGVPGLIDHVYGGR